MDSVIRSRCIEPFQPETQRGTVHVYKAGTLSYVISILVESKIS